MLRVAKFATLRPPRRTYPPIGERCSRQLGDLKKPRRMRGFKTQICSLIKYRVGTFNRSTRTTDNRNSLRLSLPGCDTCVAFQTVNWRLARMRRMRRFSKFRSSASPSRGGFCAPVRWRELRVTRHRPTDQRTSGPENPVHSPTESGSGPRLKGPLILVEYELRSFCRGQ
jgi:hypothetical protein